MTTHDNLAVAAGHSVDPGRWLGILDELLLRIGARFRRVEPRRRARAFIVGLLAALPRKNCWTIAEHAGEVTPGGMQHLLSRASWDADGIRDDVRGYVIEHLGDLGAVLVVDETGDVKKGTAWRAWPASTQALRAGSRTPRSRSTSPMPPRTGTR